MGYDIVQGISGAVSGATPKSSSDPPTRIRKNKQADAPMPDTYEGAGSGGPPTDSDRTSYKRGGKVKRTGMAKLHRGERVLTAKQANKYSKKRGRK